LVQVSRLVHEDMLIEIEANAFLYRMVRRIVGTLILVGKGTLSVEQFREVLAKKRRTGQSVPPQGLCLIAVNYGVMEKDENI
jgi:tRNA pseudouridine38-40 synthase